MRTVTLPTLPVLLLATISTLTAKVEEVFIFSDLEGIAFSHTDFGERPGDGLGYLINPDKISGDIKILRETDGKDKKLFISHNGGLNPVVLVSGTSSLTFVELYGGNNYLWTVCLEENNFDGSCMLIMTANLADGSMGIRSKVFRGKATTPKD